jgi:4-amino-4-deoxy-L-arabinose transferase-like glycosyltransferase
MRDSVQLALLAVVFLFWHVPLMFRSAAGQDEDFYGVPGITVRHQGVPRIPYIPSRDPHCIYYEADVALYALPPLSFYLQGLVHLVFGDGLGQARLASVLEGVLAVFLVYGLGRLWFEDLRGALWGAGFYLFSRAFLFPATMARPDMAATAFGLGALWWGARGGWDGSFRVVGISGICAGLSLLCHPLGLVPAAQVGLAIPLLPRTSSGIPPRVRAAVLYTAAALATFSLWGIWIAFHPHLFAIQFGGNVLQRAGPGIGRTMLSLESVVRFQLGEIVGLAQPIQAGLYALGVVWAIVQARRPGRGREFLFHFATAVLLLSLLMGRHPIRAYYVYPAALASIAVGMLASQAADWLGRVTKIAPACVGSLIIIALIAGSGLRTLEAHLQHWHDPHYRVQEFTREILKDVPESALIAVDRPYVLNAYLAGRRVVEAMADPFYYDVRAEPFEYVILGPVGIEQTKPLLDGLELVRISGNTRDPFGNYAELYRRVGNHAQLDASGRPR